MVTKKQIAEAVAKFITNDLVQGIDDKQLKFVLCLTKQSLLENPDVLDMFMDNPMIESVIYEEEGMYEVKDFVSMLKKVLDEYSSYPISVPKVPLLLSHEKIIRINSADIDKIVSYLHDTESV